MNEAFDPRLQLDKGSEVRQARHGAGDSLTHLVFVGRQIPGLWLKLFQPEGNAPARSVRFQNLDLELLTYGQHILRMIRSAPRDIADVQQPIDASKIDEGPVGGE